MSVSVTSWRQPGCAFKLNFWYDIMRTIGRGVNGTVYEKNGLALKHTRVYSPTEIRALLRLRGAPFVPKVHSYGRYWFTMNLLPPGSKTLGKWKKTATAFQRVSALSQLKSILNALHKNYHISHGDLHQDNILVNRTGKVWLVDFGRSQFLRGNENSAYTKSRYVFNYNGVPTYSFKGILARKNSNMIKKISTGL